MFVRRIRAGLVVVVTTVLVLAAVAVSQGKTPTKTKAKSPTVKVDQTFAGKLLVNSKTRTVFVFTRNKRGTKKGDDVCATIKNCLTDWPAVTTTGKPVAGPGLKASLLKTIPFKGKLRQVTYNGYPLHTYKFDVGKGSSMNIGNKQFGGSWYGLNPAGHEVK